MDSPSSALLEEALAAGQAGTFRWDLRTNALSWDQALDRLFGVRPGEVVRSLAQFIANVHPADRDEVIARCEKCRLEGADFDFEYRIVQPSGAVRWVYDRGRTFRDADGKPAWMTGACVDVTERHEIDRALRESESFYRQMLETIPGMAFTTRPDGYCDYLSEQWPGFTGQPVSAHLGDGWLDALHPDDRARASDAWASAVSGKAPYDLEYRMRRADGQYEWFKARARPLRHADGTIARWVGALVNVEDLKQTQARLVARELELRTLTANSPDLIVRFDRQQRHVFINEAIVPITGLRPSDFLGKTNAELGMPPHLLHFWSASIQRVLDGHGPETIAYAFESPTGLRHFSSRLVPEVGADGRIESVLAVTRDITDAAAAEEAQRQVSRNKDEFIAILAHELRNPLAPIRTGLEVLKRDPASDAASRTRDMMERQLGHLVRLVDDLLDVSRISIGKVELQKQRVAVEVIVEHALESCRALLEASGKRVTTTFDAQPLFVDGDLTRLSQVLGNLLNNAVKYTAPGGRIELSVERRGDELVLRVTDDGVGIEAQMLPRVFELFAQVDRTRERAQGGLGIGLSLVRQLTELHGGRVEAHSEGLGRGSTFALWLPLASASRQDAPAKAAGATGPGRRVLVVDDNRDAAESLSMMLSLLGHSTRVAHDGPHALAAVGEAMPEVVFLDIGLPGMTGYEVAARLRREAASSGLVLVALTGWGTKEDKRKSAEAGFDLHLTKPVELEALQQALAHRTTPATTAPPVTRGTGSSPR